jgi:very-short-patch-repair endonuclease
MKDLSPAAMRIFAAQHGVATGSMLSDAGVGRRVRQRLVEAGMLHLEHERVYRITSTPDTVHSRCVALCLAYPRAFVTGPTAGMLLGLRRMPSSEQIHLAIPHGANVGPIDGVLLRQTTKVRSSDRVIRPDGITTASPARLIFDLSRDLGRLDLASVIEQVLDRRMTTLAALARTGRDLAHPGRAGSAAFMRALLARSDGGAAQSHIEVTIDQRLRQQGVPVVRQVAPLRLPDGSIIRLDLAVPDVRWGIEIDVHPHHLLLDGTTRDKRRDRQCHLIGWQVDRVTELDVIDLDGLIGELVTLYNARCRQLAA